MKQLLVFVGGVLAVSSLASGLNFESPIAFLPSAKNVYVVTVASVDADNNVTFGINEVLRGDHVSRLVLKPYMNTKYAVGSYWVLASCSAGTKDSVGLAGIGYCGWIPMSVSRKDGQAFIWAQVDQIEGVDLDMASDGTKGLTLAHIRRLVQQK